MSSDVAPLGTCTLAYIYIGEAPTDIDIDASTSTPTGPGARCSGRGVRPAVLAAVNTGLAAAGGAWHGHACVYMHKGRRVRLCGGGAGGCPGGLPIVARDVLGFWRAAQHACVAWLEIEVGIADLLVCWQLCRVARCLASFLPVGFHVM